MHTLFLCLLASYTILISAGTYNYREALGKSILFWEAQKTGKLPGTNKIPWRKDSFVNDVGVNGEDLSGGYFEGADFVKYTFPMASSATVLGWGLLDFSTGYILADQLQNGLSSLKWATDYFMKIHPIGKDLLYVMVGSLTDDHMYWGRPEDWPASKTRPAYFINATLPGSDVAAETAAALAAASIVFNHFNNISNPVFSEVSTSYAALCLTHAKQLYAFANNSRGSYSDSVPIVRPYYGSWSGYGDELGWAAAWLYKATKDSMYLQDLHRHWRDFKLNTKPTQFNWNLKTAGLQALMATLFPTNDMYADTVKDFCDWAIFSAARTPKKLLFPTENAAGVLRHAANTAFVCIEAATAGISNATYLRFAKEQIDYILGDSGRSFVGGFGTNPPKSPFHRTSSCSMAPDSCDWSNFLKATPNPNELTGALVAGPNATDGYVDNRANQQQNEVSLNFNAGFQSTLAALAYFKSQGLVY